MVNILKFVNKNTNKTIPDQRGLHLMTLLTVTHEYS